MKIDIYIPFMLWDTLSTCKVCCATAATHVLLNRPSRACQSVSKGVYARSWNVSQKPWCPSQYLFCCFIYIQYIRKRNTLCINRAGITRECAEPILPNTNENCPTLGFFGFAGTKPTEKRKWFSTISCMSINTGLNKLVSKGVVKFGWCPVKSPLHPVEHWAY